MQSLNSLILEKFTEPNVFFGPQGFSFSMSNEDLLKLQKMYSEDEFWGSSWLVFSRDTELGDPYFIDTKEDTLPVYTAMHGEDEWEIELVASSLNSFLECMNILANISNQENAQIIPNESTITDSNQLNDLKNKLIESSGCEEFWDMFMECYLDWLEEDDSY